MKMKVTSLYAAMFSAMIGVAGCSSDGDTTSSAANVRGTITGFGSVYVNGVEYETDGATITIDGVPATEAHLSVGMLVTIAGSDDGTNGNATSISFNDELEGVVTQNDPGSLVVMGYNIITDNTTNLDGFTDIATLVVGDEVEISGFPDGNGNIVATYIERKGTYVDGNEIEVKGVVAALTADTFTIGSMTVNFATADISDAPNLAEGMYVEVKGESAPVANIFTATKVELEDNDIDSDEGEEIEVEGILAAIDDTTVTIGNDTYSLAADAEIDDVAIGDMVELEMEMVNGEILVKEVEKEDADDDHPNKIEVEAIATATDTTNNTITLAGLTITVNPNTTVMLDNSSNDGHGEHYFNLGSVVEGVDRIEVEAAPDGNGGYAAISIERVNSTSTTVELEGPALVDGVSGTITIAGITLDVTTNGIDTSMITGSNKVHVNGTLAQDGSLIVIAIEAE